MSEPAAFCTGCGKPAGQCPGCTPSYDPARFCAQCGRRLTVQVTPTRVTSRCRDHGDVNNPYG